MNILFALLSTIDGDDLPELKPRWVLCRQQTVFFILITLYFLKMS